MVLHLFLQNQLGTSCLCFQLQNRNSFHLVTSKQTGRHCLKYIACALFTFVLCGQTVTNVFTFPISITLECSLYCVLFTGWLIEKGRFLNRAEPAAELFNLLLSYEKNNSKGKITLNTENKKEPFFTKFTVVQSTLTTCFGLNIKLFLCRQNWKGAITNLGSFATANIGYPHSQVII